MTPNESEREWIHGKYIDELLKNQFLSETRTALMAIIERMQRENEIKAVVLAGTELPLLLRDANPADLPFLDTTLIHVRAAVEAILS